MSFEMMNKIVTFFTEQGWTLKVCSKADMHVLLLNVTFKVSQKYPNFVQIYD